MIALKCAMDRRKKSAPTARDYVQDGLVAMWDGIENDGWGRHKNGQTSSITDLTGNYTISTRYSQYPMSLFDEEIGISLVYNIVFDGSLWSDGITIEMVRKSDKCVYCTWMDTVLNVVYNAAWWGYGNIYGLSIPVKTPSICIGAKYQRMTTTATGTSGTLSVIPGPNGDPIGTYDYDGGSLSGSDSMNLSSKTTTELNYFNAVRIYSRALTAAEISANYAVDKARFNIA